MQKLILFLLPILFLTSCENHDEPDNGENPAPLIVEGWIDEGESPVVMVTHAVDLSQDISSFDGLVEKWGRVSIFDGDTRYLLTGRINNDYTPRFIFTSTHLKGECGHTYRLLIETEEARAEGISTLSKAPKISGLEPVAESDGTWSIRARFEGIEPEGAYRVMVRDYSEDSRFYGAFLGTFRGADYDDAEGFKVTRSARSMYADKEEFSHFFESGHRVAVKICTLDEASFRFWKLYDDTMSLSQNVFFSFTENLPSTLTGACGCFSARGISTRTLLLP